MQRFPINVLAAARTLTGLSQGGLASRAGVTRNTIVRAEQGLGIHERNMVSILEALSKNGVTITIKDDHLGIGLSFLKFREKELEE